LSEQGTTLAFNSRYPMIEHRNVHIGMIQANLNVTFTSSDWQFHRFTPTGWGQINESLSTGNSIPCEDCSAMALPPVRAFTPRFHNCEIS
jgi:hypothetical protein